MWTKLDDVLHRMIMVVPEWQQVLSPEECSMVHQRVHGATFKDLASSYGLSIPAVRARLYGVGNGGTRRGGALGRLRGRHIHNCRQNAEPKDSQAIRDERIHGGARPNGW